MVVLLRVAVVLNFLLVQQQHKDLVLFAVRENIKIQIHIQVPLVKVALLRVAEVLDLLPVPQQQSERALNVERENIKILLHMPVLLVKVAVDPVVLELD